MTAGAGSTWTATLPNSTATYTFTASYAGNASYHGASATCTVETTEVTVLPNPPEAEDGKQYQVVMENGISEVPAGLKDIETLNTPEKLETVISLLCREVPLPEVYRDHALINSRNYKNVRECHIEPDWLLVYKVEKDRLVLQLLRTGTHSDLF